jgi:high-affinity nickel permease
MPGGFGFPLGFAASSLVTMLAVAAGSTRHPTWSLLALVATVIVVSTVTTPLAALDTAVLCWAWHTGFVLNRRGELTFTTASASAAVVLVTTAIVVVVITGASRGARHRVGRHRRALASIPAPGCPARCDTVSGR